MYILSTFSVQFGLFSPTNNQNLKIPGQSAKPLPELIITMFVYLLPVPSEDCTALLNRKRTS